MGNLVLWVGPLASDEKVRLCKEMGEPALAEHCTAVLTARAGRWGLLPSWALWQAVRRVFAGWIPDEAYAAAVARVEAAAARASVLVPALAEPEPPPVPEPVAPPELPFGGLTLDDLRALVFGAA